MKKIFIIFTIVLFFVCVSSGYAQEKIDCYNGDIESCKEILETNKKERIVDPRSAWPSICYSNSKTPRSVSIIENKSDNPKVVVTYHELDDDTITVSVLLSLHMITTPIIKIKKAYALYGDIYIAYKVFYRTEKERKMLFKARTLYTQQCFGGWAPEWETDTLFEEYIDIHYEKLMEDLYKSTRTKD